MPYGDRAPKASSSVAATVTAPRPAGVPHPPPAPGVAGATVSERLTWTAGCFWPELSNDSEFEPPRGAAAATAVSLLAKSHRPDEYPRMDV